MSATAAPTLDEVRAQVESLDAPGFWNALRLLGPLRIISICGPSVFEAITTVGPFGVAEGYLNVISESYHWHVDLKRCRHLRSQDAVHGRSGRRVLFFELREQAEGAPFLMIYLHRGKGEEFDEVREQAFAALHGIARNGLELLPVGGEKP